MAIPVLTDAEFDVLIAARVKPFLVEIAQHQLNAVAASDELDAATTAHTAASTPDTLARLRMSVAVLKASGDAIRRLASDVQALDRLAAGSANSAVRARNKSGQAIAAANAVVIPDEPKPVVP